jgi:hypothetical protein
MGDVRGIATDGPSSIEPNAGPAGLLALRDGSSSVD